MHDQNDDVHELKHDPWPGYRKAFLIVFGLAVLYLLIIFLGSPWGNIADAHH